METECQIVSDTQVLFSLRMEMSHNDSETYNFIFEALYRYFNKIRDEGPQFKIMKMLKDIRVMRYQSDIEGTKRIAWDLVDVLSGVSNDEDIEQLLTVKAGIPDFNADQIKSIAEHLADPSKVMIFLSSQRYDKRMSVINQKSARTTRSKNTLDLDAAFGSNFQNLNDKTMKIEPIYGTKFSVSNIP